jgi:hypothetical protein
MDKINGYVIQKLRNKLEIIKEHGQELDNIDELIQKIIYNEDSTYGFNGWGTYEVIWTTDYKNPIAINKMSDDCVIEETNSGYIVKDHLKFTKMLFWSQIIRFDIEEWREERINLILNEKV